MKENKSNLISQIFWAHTKAIWSSLSIGGKQKWLAKAIEVTQNAWADATLGTDLQCPLQYSNFAFNIKADTDMNAVYEDVVVHSPAMYYAKLDRKCKNMWDAVAVKQILMQLCNQYALRDAGIW